MRYVVPNFARGLVDRGAAAKLSDNYAQKCSELENFYITADNTVRRRPPLLSTPGGIIDDPNTTDFRTVDNRLVVLADVALRDLENLPEELKKMLWMDSVTGHRFPFATHFTKNGSEFTYDTTEPVTIGGTEYTARIKLRAIIQRISIYDVETKEYKEQDSYILASFHHKTEVEYTSSSYSGTISIGAARALADGNRAKIPDAVSPEEIGDPVVVAIFRGGYTEAKLLASGHTMPYKPDEAIKPSIKVARTQDPRLRYFPIILDSPNGQAEFLSVDPDRLDISIPHIDPHADGGITFLFAGFRYRWDTTLRCLNGPSLLPDYSELSHTYLKSYVADNKIGEEPTLPIKVLYIPTTTTKQDDEPRFQYTLKTVATALAERQEDDGPGGLEPLVETVEQSGLVTDSSTDALENLLDGKKIRGFTLQAFRELFPILAPITSNIKNVVGYSRDAYQTTGFMYPDIKYLTSGTDVNGAGTEVPLYTRGVGANTNTRTAVVQPSAPQVAVRPTSEKTLAKSATVELPAAYGFMSESEDVQRFPSGSGYAAGGIGITVALYKNYTSRKGIRATNTVEVSRQEDRRIQQPDGILYFFYDYDRPEVQGALDNVPMLSGFSAAGEAYQSVVMRKAMTAKWRPPIEDQTDYIGTLIRAMRFAISDSGERVDVGTSGASFYNDIQTAEEVRITDNKAFLLWPFGPDVTNIKNFGVPVYISSLNQTDNNLSLLAQDTDLSNLASSTSQDTVTEHNEIQVAAGGVGFKPLTQLARYIAFPTTYTPAFGDVHTLPGRAALSNDNKLFFSAAGFVDEFSNHIGDYFGRISNTPNSTEILRNSGLISTAILPAPTDPQNFVFTTPTGAKDKIRSVIGPSQANILIGSDNSVKHVVPASFGEYIQFENISTAGVTADFIHDSSFFVTASDSDILTAQYHRQALGFLVNIVNPETRLIPKIDSIVSLIPKHRIMLLHGSGDNIVTVVSVGSDRNFKGISKFSFPVKIHRMKQVSDDKVGFILQDGTYAELDFRADENTDYTDNIAGSKNKFNSIITTLPMYTMDAKRFSPGTRMTIRELFFCLYGYIDATVSIVNDETDAHATFDIRHPEPGDATKLKLFSGIYPQKTLPANGSIAPRIRIEKNDNRYMSINSLVAEVQ